MSIVSSAFSRIRTTPVWLLLAYGLITIALIIFIGYFVIYNMYAFSLFRFPFDYDQGEGFELMDTILLSRGQWPYRDINSYPFYSSNYPPIYHLVIVPLVWLFGPAYWTGRLVAYLGTLITATAIGYAIYRESKKTWLSVLSSLLFLASNYIYHVGPLFRQHMFMVMFETLAVVLLTVVVDREERTGRRNDRGLFLVMLLLLLAGYTKQLAYATVLAVFGFLFLRQTKRSILWAIPFGIVTVVIFFIIDRSTNGQWLINTITANVNPYIPAQGIGLLRQWFNIHLVITIAAFAVVFYQLYFSRLSAYAIWFVLAAANGLTAGKWGAGESYYATAIAATCILAGLAINGFISWNQRKGHIRYAFSLAFVAILLLYQANLFFHLPTHTKTLQTIARLAGKPSETWVAPQTSCSESQPPVPVPYVDSAGVGLIGRPPDENDIEAGIEIANFVSNKSSAAFSEDAGFNLYVGEDAITNPTQLLNLYNNGQVDLSEMLRMLENQEFDSVVFRAQFYPPPVLEVIGRNYETTKLVEMNGFVYCLLTPREDPLS